MQEKHLSWADIDSLSAELRKKIGDNKYDWVVSINRGGCIPGVILSEMLSAKHGVVSVLNYDKKTRSKLHRTESDLYISQIGFIKPHHKVLFVDNVIRSGDTIKAAIKAAKKVDGDIKIVDTACLHLDVHSTHTPTYHVGTLEGKEWIVYPWEEHDKPRKT
jgi:hypoxanthine phosphoribosyltransferase